MARTMVGSRSKYFAIPPHTPEILLLVVFAKFFFIVVYCCFVVLLLCCFVGRGGPVLFFVGAKIGAFSDIDEILTMLSVEIYRFSYEITTLLYINKVYRLGNLRFLGQKFGYSEKK